VVEVVEGGGGGGGRCEGGRGGGSGVKQLVENLADLFPEKSTLLSLSPSVLCLEVVIHSLSDSHERDLLFLRRS